jgi:hypothetical protein
VGTHRRRGQLLPGQTQMEITLRHLAIDLDDAIEIAEPIEG